MRQRLTVLPLLLLGFCFLALTSREARAQYTVNSSFLSYNASTNQVTGVSQTSMDYYTSAYYQAYVEGYLNRQADGALLSSGSSASLVGSTTVATVTTQTVGAPGATYTLTGRHVLGTLYQNMALGGYICGNAFPYNDPYWYSRYGYFSYSGNATFYGTYPGGCLSTGNGPYVRLGETTSSLTTPPLIVTITNPRVAGALQNTTQRALLGADVTLNVSVAPNNGSGTYSWTFSGPNVITIGGGIHSTTSIVRWTQPGTYTVTIAYTAPSGVSTSSTITINVIVPALTTFEAALDPDQVNRDMNCSLLPYGATYSLGCYQGGAAERGIMWSTTAQIPAAAYLSDPQQSGIKFVQAVSVFRKQLNNGNFDCFTARSSENNVDSGWQLDTVDPYNHAEHPPRRFSEGNTLTMRDFDAPAARLDGTPPGPVIELDAVKVDDRFEVYVFYFTGGDPGNPTFQVPLRLQGVSAPLTRLVWNWGGQVTFNSAYAPVNYNIQSSLTSINSIGVSDSTTVKPMQSNARNDAFAPCPGTTVTTNPIDGARFFVRQQYIDILHRLPDQGGWDNWKTLINQCAFDTVCIHDNRIATARGFLGSSENFNNNPALANPGSHDYNREYVRLCYTNFLQRNPDDGGWDAWTNHLDTHPGDYYSLIRGFIDSAEYRSRFGTP